DPAQSVHFDKWPVHCVAGTAGADFHPLLQTGNIGQVFRKGTDNKDDGYSAFEATNLSLADYLRERKVEELYVCGLATDYCVKASALDALSLGFRTVVITDAVAAVNARPGDDIRALEEMRNRGVALVSAAEIPE
ncbi:MAG TPA: nicotinamidase, partial [Porphyromonadaceae bacterium]|nr:nicotinamidase [Porphyromonadaceae bacterium]